MLHRRHPAERASRDDPGTRPSRCRGERGVNLVEFALVLPVLLTFVFGLTDLGRAVYDYNTLANAAREGARYGIVLVDSDGFYTPYDTPGNTPGPYTASDYAGTTTIVGRASAIASTLDLSQMTVTISAPQLIYLDRVTVSVSYPFRPMMTAFVGNFNITLRASSTMLLN